MTKREIIEMGLEFTNNYYSDKYCYEKIVTYKYRGQIKTRTIIEHTEEAHKIAELLRKHKIFRCSDCGEMMSFAELEIWGDETVEELLADNCCCSLCYENAMGEDL